MVLILFGIGLCVFPFMWKFGYDPEKHGEKEMKIRQKNMFKVMGIFLVLIILVGGFFIGSLVHQKNDITANCIAIDIPYSDKILYYDNANDEYFFTKGSNWSLRNLISRDVIDHEAGKVIHESNEAMKDAIKKIKDKL